MIEAMTTPSNTPVDDFVKLHPPQEVLACLKSADLRRAALSAGEGANK